MAYRRLASLAAGQNYAVTTLLRHASGVFAVEISSPHTPASSDNKWDKKIQSVPPPGSSRLTSYSGVSSEIDEHLNEIFAPLATLEHGGTGSSPKQVQLGARLLLTLFENLSFYETITENRSDNSPEGCVVGQQLVRMIFRALKDNHKLLANGQDAEDRYYENLLGWSQKLFAETSQRLKSVRRQHRRNIFAVSPIDGKASRWFSPSWVKVPCWRESGSLYLSVIHDPLGWLLYQHTHLLTLIYGNNDYRAWRALSQLSTVVFSLGLNQAKVNARMPFFLVELRKRLMAGAYIMDKQLATCLGRPPQIIWRYCDVQLPLDLRYDEILADPATRDAATNRLDATGWNSQGIIQTAQWMRVSLLVSSIREQILELSLSRCVDDLARKTKQVSDNSRKTWDELPGFLRWRPGSASSGDSGSLLIPLYLDFLYNDFLLARLLVKRLQTEADSLINVSQAILGTVLELIGRELASGTGTCSIGWNASSFGIPAAGVLAIELLRQRDGSSRPTPSTLRRPEAIQNLSVFASYLQFVVFPHEGNYEICQRARRILGRILNQILSPNPSPFPSRLPADAVVADWLNGESILLDDGTNLLEWIESRLE
ncbi:hypothetical protein KXW25_007573 [Aspergillus fumigatus]|nr:hypothetical protein KXW25_007573 [Aspergillus fumigatus]